MEATEIQELLNALKAAKEDYWMPLSLLSGACAIIISLIIGWSRSIVNNNNKDHEDMRELIKIQGEVNEGVQQTQSELKDFVMANKIDLTEHKVKIQNLEKKVG